MILASQHVSSLQCPKSGGGPRSDLRQFHRAFLSRVNAHLTRKGLLLKRDSMVEFFHYH
jgi:hypothetical protein